MEPYWEFIVENEAALRATCRFMCRGRYDLVDDLFCDCCVARAEDIWNTYDPTHESGASLDTHMFGNMRRYMWKWMNRMGRPYGERHYVQPADDFDAGGNHAFVAIDDRDEVQYILERLPEFQRTVLLMYLAKDMTFAEMADVMGCARGTARNHYLRALAAARELVGIAADD